MHSGYLAGSSLQGAHEETTTETKGSSAKRIQQKTSAASLFKVSLKLAGAGGIEPPNGGIKIRCLTAWRRPNDAFL